MMPKTLSAALIRGRVPAFGQGHAPGKSMSISTVLAIYFILWWLVLIVMLPIGVHSQHETGEVTPGTDPGAPAAHLIWRKLLWTTVAATIVFAIGFAVYKANLFPLDWLIEISNPPHH
jgi:predicted secreted protein